MDINDMTLGQIKELIATHGQPAITSPQQNIGDKVIVRCRDAGVHFGTLVSYSGREVVLTASRRMYYWEAKKGHTLSGCAIYGITNESQIAGELTSIVLLEACEIIPCTPTAITTIEGADEHHAYRL